MLTFVWTNHVNVLIIMHLVITGTDPRFARGGPWRARGAARAPSGVQGQPLVGVRERSHPEAESFSSIFMQKRTKS